MTEFILHQLQNWDQWKERTSKIKGPDMKSFNAALISSLVFMMMFCCKILLAFSFLTFFFGAGWVLFAGWPLGKDIIGLWVALLTVDDTVVFFNEAVFVVPLFDVVVLVVVVLVEVIVLIVVVLVVVVFCWVVVFAQS